MKPMSSSYNTPWIKHKLVVSIYSNTEPSLAMSTLAIWCRVVQSRDVRSRVFSRPTKTLKQPWNVSTFYFTFCATAEIKRFRRLETEFFYLFYFSSFISIVRIPLQTLSSFFDRTLIFFVLIDWFDWTWNISWHSWSCSGCANFRC